ncbi:hypothetical protein SEVIR_9G133501v4 [Setaria viridis]
MYQYSSSSSSSESSDWSASSPSSDWLSSSSLASSSSCDDSSDSSSFTYAFTCWTCWIFPHSEDSSCNAISLSKLRLQSTRNFFSFASRKYSGSDLASSSCHSRLRRDGKPSNSFSAGHLVMSMNCKLGLLLILSSLGLSYDQSVTNFGSLPNLLFTSLGLVKF